MSTMGERIRQAREAKGLYQADLASKIGVKSAAVISNWEKDLNKPDAEKIVRLCDTLNISLSYLLNYYGDSPFQLTNSEMGHIQKYRALDKHGKEMVSLVLNKECERCSEPVIQVANEENTSLFPIDYLHQPVSAGTGLYTDETDFDELDLIKRPPRGSTCVIRVSGDSMEPTYRDGDKVFVRAQNVINPGQIGIFVIDGDLFFKELGDGALISHNSVYDPIPLNEDSRIECQGLVLGVCTDDYLYK